MYLQELQRNNLDEDSIINLRELRGVFKKVTYLHLQLNQVLSGLMSPMKERQFPLKHLFQGTDNVGRCSIHKITGNLLNEAIVPSFLTFLFPFLFEHHMFLVKATVVALLDGKCLPHLSY